MDSGIHSEGWEQEQAVEYMMANTADSEEDIRSEVVRYIGWPGQVCSLLALNDALPCSRMSAVRVYVRSSLIDAGFGVQVGTIGDLAAKRRAEGRIWAEEL